MFVLLPPATKLGQGYVFTGVCDSVQGGVPDQVHPPGPGTPPWDQVHRPWDQVPPGPGTPPDQVHPPWTRYTPQTKYPRDQVHPPRPGAPPP